MPSLMRAHVSMHRPSRGLRHVIPDKPRRDLEDCNAKGTIRMTTPTTNNGVRQTKIDESGELARLVSDLHDDETLQDYARKVDIVRSHVTFKIDRHEHIRRCVEKLSDASYT
jgi:hypothetical protein